jgi:hypothetical protein
MRLLSGSLVVALCIVFGCCQPLTATPVNPIAIKQAASANSTTQEIVYTYRRTKHGFERCHHRNLRDAKLAERLPQDTRLLR